MYIIQVKEKYGKDQHFVTETNFTNGNRFDYEEARRLKNLLQKYSTSVIYKVKEVKS